jgi:hypothetical protein
MNKSTTNSIGPLKAIGKVLHTATTVVGVVDTTVTQAGDVISTGLSSINSITSGLKEVLEITMAGPIEDLKTDEIVASAYREVRIAEAKAEAKGILAKLNTTPISKEI